MFYAELLGGELPRQNMVRKAGVLKPELSRKASELILRHTMWSTRWYSTDAAPSAGNAAMSDHFQRNWKNVVQVRLMA